jgi:hypothetical protein
LWSACRVIALCSLNLKFMASWLKDALPVRTDLMMPNVNPSAENFALLRTISLLFLANESNREKNDFERSASLEPEMVFNMPSLPARSACQWKSAAFPVLFR